MKRPLLVLAGSAVLVAGAVAVSAQQADGPPGSPLAPAAAFSVLAAPQQPTDIIDNDRMRHIVRPETTRLLGESPLGTAYLAMGRTGDACLVTMPADGTDLVPEAGCSSWPTDRNEVALLTEGPRGGGVALVPDGYEAGTDWRTVSRNLLVKESN